MGKDLAIIGIVIAIGRNDQPIVIKQRPTQFRHIVVHEREPSLGHICAILENGCRLRQGDGRGYADFAQALIPIVTAEEKPLAVRVVREGIAAPGEGVPIAIQAGQTKRADIAQRGSFQKGEIGKGEWVRSPLDFSGVRSNRWASPKEDGGRVVGRREKTRRWGSRRTEEFRRDPGSPELESIGAPFGQDTGNEKAAPPEVDGSRLLWYTIGDLRATLAGVEMGPLSVP